MKTENGRDGIRNNQSGEIVIAILVGLAIGAVASVINYNGWAQNKANLTGMEVGASDYMAEEPVVAFGLPIGGALLGAGVGALIDGFSSSDDSGNDSSVRIEAGGDVQYSGNDGSQEQGNRPTTTTTTTHPTAPATPAGNTP